MLCYNYYANEQANLKQKKNNLTADHEKKWSSTRKVHITRWTNSMSKGFLVGGFTEKSWFIAVNMGIDISKNFLDNAFT